jgi:hypothetical protein
MQMFNKIAATTTVAFVHSRCHGFSFDLQRKEGKQSGKNNNEKLHSSQTKLKMADWRKILV